ncbi:MAG: hypothetical protein ACOY3K_08945 [Candidatus Omnitrophota bacterium]
MLRIFSWRLGFYLIVLVTLDMTLGARARVGNACLFLSYLPVIYAAFHWGGAKALPTAVMVGILRDTASTGFLGLETLSLVLASWPLMVAVQKLRRELWMLKAGITFLFVLTVLLIQGSIWMIFGRFSFQIEMLLGTLLGSALYTTLAAFPFFKLSDRWFEGRMHLKQYEFFRRT